MIEEYRLSKLDGDVFFIMVFLLQKKTAGKPELTRVSAVLSERFTVELPEGKNMSIREFEPGRA